MKESKEIRVLWGFLCFFCVFILAGCGKENKAEKSLTAAESVSTSYLQGKSVDLPALGLLSGEFAFQPIVGTSTRIEPATYQKAEALCDAAGFRFWAKGDWQGHLWRMELYRASDGSLLRKKNDFDLSYQPETLKAGELYD